MMPHRYFLIYKPYGVLSQFSSDDPAKRTLAELHDFPKDVYPVGRLDEDSEGLLLLTNDPKMNAVLLGQKIEKEYWVQVEGIPGEGALEKLRRGHYRAQGALLYAAGHCAQAGARARLACAHPTHPRAGNDSRLLGVDHDLGGKKSASAENDGRSGFPDLALGAVAVG